MHINVKNSKTISTLTFIDCIANSISKYDNAVTTCMGNDFGYEYITYKRRD